MVPREAKIRISGRRPAADGTKNLRHAGLGRSLAPRAWQLLLWLVGGWRTAPEGEDVDGTDALTSTVSFSEELRVLGLYGCPFGWEDYRDRLAAHLGIDIRVVFVEEHTHPVLHMVLTQEGAPGLVRRDEETGDALIMVLASLSDLARRLVVLHELSHVAGGHPMPTDDPLGSTMPGREDSFWDPPRSVLGPPAPRDEELCERDARLRAELALQASLFGDDPQRADESFFLLDGK